MSSNRVITAIDNAAQRALTEAKRRGHLGASAIGGRCIRQAWYSFRWAYNEQHTGRLLRLFRRGHEEEYNFVGDLRNAGFEVRDYAQRLCWNTDRVDYDAIDWDDPLGPWREDVSASRAHIELALAEGVPLKQWGFTDHEKHFAGSSDGKCLPPEGLGLPLEWIGTEFKTHNDRSFKALVSKGVVSSKPVHYVQMQVYMHYMKLNYCLYLAVNKNDDTLHSELVAYKPEVAQYYVDRAEGIIWAKQAPPRVTEDPSWFECKWCAFREICHYGEAPQKNCRSCIFAAPGPQGAWHCQYHRQDIPNEYLQHGCDAWESI